MNENNENKSIPDDSGNEASTEAFKADFNDEAAEANANGEPCVEEMGELDITPTEPVEDAGKQDGKRCRRRRISTKALIRESNLAICLSAISIILLVAIATLLTVGILPVGNRMVYVNVSTLGPVEGQNGSASSELLEKFKKSVVIIEAARAESTGTGSGIIISSDGFIVTNHHVIEGASKIAVTFYGEEKRLIATVVGYSERDDIAVIKVEANDLLPAVFASSADCRIGDRVYAVGAPEGTDFGWTVTSGIISDPLRELKIYASDYVLEKKMYMLQTDTPVNPGNSGGPLINTRGEVVGIVTLKRSDSAGLGFALPSSASLEIIEAIIENGNAAGVVSKISKGRPLIGITGIGLDADVWYELTADGAHTVNDAYAIKHPDRCIKLSTPGVYVTSLSPNLDASNHLVQSDVITHVNGVRVYTTYGIMDIINELDGGDSISVTFVRDGEPSTVSITLGTEE